jgi:hypothetical protein
MTTETYSYKGEAIRLLNERLGDPSKATDDASLATIISLANFDVRISVHYPLGALKANSDCSCNSAVPTIEHHVKPT